MANIGVVAYSATKESASNVPNIFALMKQHCGKDKPFSFFRVAGSARELFAWLFFMVAFLPKPLVSLITRMETLHAVVIHVHEDSIRAFDVLQMIAMMQKLKIIDKLPVIYIITATLAIQQHHRFPKSLKNYETLPLPMSADIFKEEVTGHMRQYLADLD